MMLHLLFSIITSLTIAAQLVTSYPTESARSLIVNGEDAAFGRYPYFVTLDHYGAGVLIASDIVLTAGHTKPKRHAHLHPHVGTYSFDSEEGVEVFAIADMIRHPEYVRVGDDEFRMDFSILKLSGHSKAPVISINRYDFVPHAKQDVIAIGMGTVDPSSDERPNVLQQAMLQYLPTELCLQASDPESGESYQDRIFPSHMCTVSAPHNQRDACGYDSGGPIIAKGGITHGGKNDPDVLVGLVSWGIGCADPNFPAVNARVSTVSEWIDQQVCRLSENPPADFHCNTNPAAPHRQSFSRWMALAVAVKAAIVIIICIGPRRPNTRNYKLLKPVDLEETASLVDSFSTNSTIESWPSPLGYQSMGSTTPCRLERTLTV